MGLQRLLLPLYAHMDRREKVYEPEYRHTAKLGTWPFWKVIKPLPTRPLPAQSCVREEKFKGSKRT